MSRSIPLVVASTNLLRLKALRDVLTKLYPTDAIVSGTLFDATGTTPIAGAVGIAMSYVAGTSGHATEYRGTLPASVALVIDTSYLLKVTAIDTAGDVHVFQKTCLAVAG
jgi:hypothetical protein